MRQLRPRLWALSILRPTVSAHLERVKTAVRAVARDHRAEARLLPRLALYRVSRGRLGSSSDLYRAAIPWQSLTLGDVPGMTAVTERAYFAWHSREVFKGVGEIVDLGAWFGSTTASLASGLVKNRHPAARSRNVHAYDQFLWEPWMDDYASLAAFGPYQAGDSFEQEFERVVAPWRYRVELHAGDLHEEAWDAGAIEVLLVDAMKSWSLAQRIVTEFYPALVPGAAFVIHQDFSNAYTPWIHLSTYRLRELLVPVADIPDSETLVFGLGRHGLEQPGLLELSRASFDREEIDLAFAHSLSIAEAPKHSGIRTSHVMLHIYDGDLDLAHKTLGEYERAGEIDPYHALVLRDELERARALAPRA
jgi:hypothetical protein